VYGHDLAARNGLELLLRRMGLKPIVLADLPAAGDTIIEMLEKYLRDARNVGYACVLLTPDDQGHRVGAPEETKHRARQNVILELGMVLSRLDMRARSHPLQTLGGGSRATSMVLSTSASTSRWTKSRRNCSASCRRRAITRTPARFNAKEMLKASV
jgi:hypothetical protein